MGLALISFIQNHWPFKQRKLDDLELSDRLVNRLSIPEHTKKFVYAIVEPESGAVVYVLAAQNLSRQSALDAECLIKEVRPDVVVTQVAPSCTEEIRNNKSNDVNAVPTSLFGVLKGCFVDKIDKDKYESLAGSVLLKAIFGVGFYGHFFAAKKAAEEVGSEVYYVESPFVSSCADEVNNHSVESNEVEKNVRALSSSASSLVPQNASSGVSSKRLFSTGNQHSETLKSLASALSQLNQEAGVSSSVSRAGLGDCHSVHDYRAPSFAQTVYPLLIDLHSVFGNLPSIDTALAHAQKMFYSVSNGERVDKQLLSEVQNFQIAVEGLRIGLNSAGRCPINKAEKSTSCKPEFSELPTEDKSHVLFAQAIRSQTQNFKSVVAIVDASSLAGLRKHWNTSLPAEVKDMIKESITKYESDEEISSAKNPDKKRLIPDKPVVAVGAGATAVLGASSLSKVVPASTFVKLVTLKIPTSLKIALAQTHKAVAISFGKAFGTSQVTSPGLITSGAKSASVMKGAASTKSINAVTHSIRAYAQRTSFSAMRTAFYEIMRKRYVQPIGYMPWIKFGCSVSACSGLLMYGDGIECAVESMPVAPAIASLGRGLQNLHKANQVVKRADSTKVLTKQAGLKLQNNVNAQLDRLAATLKARTAEVHKVQKLRMRDAETLKKLMDERDRALTEVDRQKALLERAHQDAATRNGRLNNIKEKYTEVVAYYETELERDLRIGSANSDLVADFAALCEQHKAECETFAPKYDRFLANHPQDDVPEIPESEAMSEMAKLLGLSLDDQSPGKTVGGDISSSGGGAGGQETSTVRMSADGKVVSTSGGTEHIVQQATPSVDHVVEIL